MTWKATVETWLSYPELDTELKQQFSGIGWTLSTLLKNRKDCSEGPCC
jgi:hypothetical protein